ncbi:MAG: pentapeptide repeat-containing protein [Proteobacteria bacterium]|nr:pentapeptide repeat-containing protein [Pseudomonadota bacterium]
MTGKKNTEEEIKLTPSEENPWFRFLWLMTQLDETSENPNGWYWLIGLHYLLGITVKRMQDNLPDDHPLKTAPLPKEGVKQSLKPIISDLRKDLENPKEITQIDFSNLEFKNFVNFSKLIFPIPVTFSNSKFHKKVEFNHTEFFLFANFSDTCFCDTVQFTEATLSTTVFQKTKFHGVVNFFNATFTKMVDFTGAIFFNDARFNNAKFQGHTDFSEVHFKNEVANFYSAEISASIVWDNDIKLWPETTAIAPRELRLNRNAYENLAYHMKKLDKYHDEHFFFRQEMRCRRQLAGNFLSRCAYGLYENVSNYGYGVGRAIVAWASHILIGAIILFGIRSVDRLNMSFDDFGCSLGISLSNSHAFFFNGDRLKRCYETFEYLPVFNLIWGLQTITGTLLLFLVLLTLRVRFRLK